MQCAANASARHAAELQALQAEVEALMAEAEQCAAIASETHTTEVDALQTEVERLPTEAQQFSFVADMHAVEVQVLQAAVERLQVEAEHFEIVASEKHAAEVQALQAEVQALKAEQQQTAGASNETNKNKGEAVAAGFAEKILDETVAERDHLQRQVQILTTSAEQTEKHHANVVLGLKSELANNRRGTFEAHMSKPQTLPAFEMINNQLAIALQLVSELYLAGWCDI